VSSPPQPMARQKRVPIVRSSAASVRISG
jgi:hypothetical protein